jgi:hypothetical protein
MTMPNRLSEMQLKLIERLAETPDLGVTMAVEFIRDHSVSVDDTVGAVLAAMQFNAASSNEDRNQSLQKIRKLIEQAHTEPASAGKATDTISNLAKAEATAADMRAEIRKQPPVVLCGNIRKYFSRTKFTLEENQF